MSTAPHRPRPVGRVDPRRAGPALCHGPGAGRRRPPAARARPRRARCRRGPPGWGRRPPASPGGSARRRRGSRPPPVAGRGRAPTRCATWTRSPRGLSAGGRAVARARPVRRGDRARGAGARGRPDRDGHPRALGAGALAVRQRGRPRPAPAPACRCCSSPPGVRAGLAGGASRGRVLVPLDGSELAEAALGPRHRAGRALPGPAPAAASGGPPATAGAADGAGYVYTDYVPAPALREAEGYLEGVARAHHEGGPPTEVAAPRGRRRPPSPASPGSAGPG